MQLGVGGGGIADMQLAVISAPVIMCIYCYRINISNSTHNLISTFQVSAKHQISTTSSYIIISRYKIIVPMCQICVSTYDVSI